MDPYVWTDAKLNHMDWVGTLALDYKMTGQESIYNWTGIDRDEWLIIGLDFGGGESGMFEPHAIAVRRSELGDRRLPDISEIEAADIQIHGIGAFELLQKITHLLDIRLRVRSTVGTTVTITELLDSPPQED